MSQSFTLGMKIFEIVTIEFRKTHLMRDKPIQIGPAVLDLSKMLMLHASLRFHQTTIRRQIHNAHVHHRFVTLILIMFTQISINITISLILAIIEKHVYCKDNKMKHGKFKDETYGIPITELIERRSKVFCVTLETYTIKKRAKGARKPGI
ncbi:hypothetical protein CHS0354_030251, partial [Potamilus streckersoni]